MAWITFAALTTVPLSDLDENFTQLAVQSVNPCAVAGTNTLTLTLLSPSNQPPVAAYADYLALSAVAALTNTGAVTAQLGSLAALPVYKDTNSGPAALVGGEIVAGNLFILVYDAALNSGAGGFHLVHSASQPLTGAAPVTVNATTGTTLTAAQVTGSGTGNAVINRTGSNSGGFNDVTPAASAIIAAIPGCGVNTYFRFLMYNNGTGQTQTVTAGSGVTVTGVATTANNTTHEFTGVVTSIASPAVTIYG